MHPGRYVIWKIAPYKTRSWPFSRIRWGVRIRIDPQNPKGEMFHATAENERDSVKDSEHIPMAYSHGCIHLKPAQRDKLIKAGIFARGRILIIHRYDEKYVRKPDDPTAAGAAL